MSQSGSTNQSGAAGAAGATELALNVREKEGKATQKQAERWAQVLLPYVAQVLPPVVLSSAAAPNAWRGGAGVLTPEAAVKLTAGPGAVTAQEGADNRVHLTVNSAELGEMSLVLERAEGGLRVVIGVESQAVGQRLLPEQHALIQSLVGNGVKLQSLSIVQQSEVGTVLAQYSSRSARDGSARAGEAQRAFTRTNREPLDREPQSSPSPGKPRRRARKLNFIG